MRIRHQNHHKNATSWEWDADFPSIVGRFKTIKRKAIALAIAVYEQMCHAKCDADEYFECLIKSVKTHM